MRWGFLGWLVFRAYGWDWSDVRRIDLLRGPFGGLHGVRIVLVDRPCQVRLNGAAYPWFRRFRRFILGLGRADVEALLELAPPAIPRANRWGLFNWR
jgi:hypothetical protein